MLFYRSIDPPWWMEPGPWLMGGNFHELVEYRHWSVSRLASGALKLRNRYGIGCTCTHHWRWSVSSDKGPRPGDSGRTDDDVFYAPKSVFTHLAGHRDRCPAATSRCRTVRTVLYVPNHLHPQTRSRDQMIHPDRTKKVTVFTGRRHLLFSPHTSPDQVTIAVYCGIGLF